MTKDELTVLRGKMIVWRLAVVSGVMESPVVCSEIQGYLDRPDLPDQERQELNQLVQASASSDRGTPVL